MTPGCKTAFASFETRLLALLRMTPFCAMKKKRHPEEAQSAVSKDARLNSSRWPA